MSVGAEVESVKGRVVSGGETSLEGYDWNVIMARWWWVLFRGLID